MSSDIFFAMSKSFVIFIVVLFLSQFSSCSGSDTPCMVNRTQYDQDLLPSMLPADLQINAGIFPLGVKACSMTDSQVILWTKSTDNIQKELLIWIKDKANKYMLVLSRSVQPKEQFIKEDIVDLLPSTQYYYVFLEKDGDKVQSRSAIGRFKTAIAGDCDNAVIIGGTHHSYVEYVKLKLTIYLLLRNKKYTYVKS